ncbi:MAG: glycoside hydrolase N-terminal domain-containing protein [Clostridia bacterium]|nr:glycoside hydrolase N-terminal domain-containing protein [Clostridia bacterium]
MKQKNYILKYGVAADDSADGWERYSLPIGNGYFGASIFGRTDSERLQFATNTFANDKPRGGVSNFAEIRLDFFHENIRDYERGLCINDGIAYVKYVANSVRWEQKSFLSYPDRVFVHRVQSSEKADFNVRLVIPYLGERTPEEGGRTGEVTTKNDNLLVMRGTLPSRDLIYEGWVRIATNGVLTAKDGVLEVRDATDTVLYFVADTSYVLKEEVFLDGCHKALGADPHEWVEQNLQRVVALGYDELLKRHTADVSALLSRVHLDFGGVADARYTDELLQSYRDGNPEPYLEELYYQYGRYLLVSSSRKGTPPASLQGCWNVHDKSPWGSGFWHNINVQMNYWPAFNSNLAETFTAYVDYYKAYHRQAAINAENYIRETAPENYVAGECGWTIGTAAYCYEISGMPENTHSGPGTGGLTAKMFWDYYDFTRDENVLREITYPAIHDTSKFMTKCLREYDGEFLTELSASPEQIIGGRGVWSLPIQPYYHTVGCAFDQQMLYENVADDLKCAELLGTSDTMTELERTQINGYSPVLIGYSGQIKEYREENFYGEIGETKHRHISQLVALSPGTQITSETPAWMDSAKQTLLLRGDDSTGWALAHRLCAWARTGDGDHAYRLLQQLLKNKTYPNLWDVHPPFQIDGNFGAVNGITEMLMQSHEGYIHLLPSVPKHLKTFSFYGLKARGNFTVSCQVQDGIIQKAEITSNVGGKVRIRAIGAKNVTVKTKDGRDVTATTDDFFCSFDSEKGETYTLVGFETAHRCAPPTKLQAAYNEKGVELAWQGTSTRYAIYRAVGNDSGYTLLGYTAENRFLDVEYNANNKARLTYRVTCIGETPATESEGTAAFLHPASALEIARYKHFMRQNNL